MVGTAATEAITVKALALGVPALTGEEHIWLAATLLVLLSLARFVAA
jgi:hypothetical protein